MGDFFRTFLPILGALVMGVLGFYAGVLYRRKVAEREIGSAEEEARRLINDAIKTAETKKGSLLEAKEEILKPKANRKRSIRNADPSCKSRKGAFSRGKSR